MNAISELKARIEAIKKDLVFSLVDAYTEAAPAIEDKVAEQLQRGERADNVVLPNYSLRSVAQFGKPAGPIRLFDTGDFYEGIRAIPEVDGLLIEGFDSKTGLLQDRYGLEIIGLQERSIAELNEEVIAPILLSNLRERLL